MRKWGVRVALAAAALTGLNYVPVAYGSLFGEENLTLVQILAQTLEVKQEMQDLNEMADITAQTIGDLRDTYAKVNAGIDELRDYSFDAFLRDFKKDFYTTYPGIAELEGASGQLRSWEELHRTQSPFTAYEAITAVAGDLSAAYRARIENGDVNIDHELVLAGEAGQSFATANTARDATRTFDDQVVALTRDLCPNGNLDDCHASPGVSEVVSARAMVILAAQNSHIIRLLSRTVQLDGVDRALEYRERMQAREQIDQFLTGSGELSKQAGQPARMLDFSELE